MFFTASDLFDFADKGLGSFPVKEAFAFITNVIFILSAFRRGLRIHGRIIIVFIGRAFPFELAVKAFQPFVGFFDIGTLFFRTNVLDLQVKR